MPNVYPNDAETLKVPFGFHAVRDAYGRATGEVLPVPNVNDRANSTPAQEPMSAAQLVRNAETRARIELLLQEEDTGDQPIIVPESFESWSRQQVLELMVPAKPAGGTRGQVVELCSLSEQPASPLSADIEAA